MSLRELRIAAEPAIAALNLRAVRGYLPVADEMALIMQLASCTDQKGTVMDHPCVAKEGMS
jgi:hypothetical protein